MGSWGVIYNNTISGVKYQARQMTRLQEQVTTGSRVIRASDDPSSAQRILSLRDNVKQLENYSDNLEQVKLLLNEGDNAISSMTDLFTRVDTLVAQAVSGTYMAENRVAVAEEIDTILEQVLSLANHKVMSQYIFGGQNSNDPPYVAQRQDGRITAVTYQGSPAEQPVPVAPGVTMTGQMVGQRILQNQQRQAPELYGETDIEVGSGTSNLCGDHWLRLRHTNTTYEAGSGLVMGSKGAEKDTILGVKHTITVDTAGQTIRLDDGPVVNYVGTETNLTIRNSDGDVAYVDVTGALADGTWSIVADGEVALDDGTFTALDFSSDNFPVTDPADPSRFLYVNAQYVARTGTESVRVPGTYDVFGTLIQIRDLLLNMENLDEDEQLEILSRAADAINEIDTGLRQRTTIIGGRLGAIETLQESLDNLKDSAGTEADAIQQADIIELATDLARAETLYELSLKVAATALSMTLLDYI
jgi:flagellar hook-associated protein 3